MNETSNFDGWKYIDWGIELDTLEFDLAAIRAHNENNPLIKEIWTQWPIEMEGIIHLPLGYISKKGHKESKLSSEQIHQLKNHWLKFAQFIWQSPNIELEENTFTVFGNHGTIFSFDANLEFSVWLPPKTTSRHIQALRAIRKGARNRSNLDNQIIYMEASIATWKFEIKGLEEELGFCDFPNHIEGLELKQFETWSTHLYPESDNFPNSLQSLIQIMIEDESIWLKLHAQELARRADLEEWNRKWPNGRPDDWMYL
tara:strand:+ start:264 stop:1034 length:771 start_codon:yes stop_codon:yes gene_type:complete